MTIESAAEAKFRARRERHDRVAAMTFGADDLAAFIEEHEGVTRESLIAAGHLRAEAPAEGTALLTEADRTESGEALLTRAKDVLFALLRPTRRWAATWPAGPRSCSPSPSLASRPSPSTLYARIINVEETSLIL